MNIYHRFSIEILITSSATGTNGRSLPNPQYLLMELAAGLKNSKISIGM